jgi:acyl-CoA synthetase (AMP-forming)/AMP-acid ligase II
MTAAATSGLAARLADVLAVDPSADAVEFQGRWRTWGDLTHTVERVAALVERPGTQVGILLRNRPACIGALLGVLRAGGCVVAINPGRGEERTRDDVAALDLALIVGEPDDLARFVPEDLPATRVAVADLGTSVDVERAAACAPPEAKEGGTAACAPPEARDRPGVAVRMLTSGTTGPPKRIDLSYPTLERVLVGAKHYESDQDGAVRLRRGVAVVNSPLVHLGGLFRVLQCVSDGRSFVLLERFTVDGWVGAVRRHRPATASLVPAALRMVLEAAPDPDDLRSLRSVVSGTAPLDPDDADAFTERYGAPVLVSYAATEFGGGVAGWNVKDHEAFWATKRGSVGRAHAGCQLRVVDPETGEPLAADEPGLLEVQAGQLDEQGWIRTTDLASIDEDGFLFILGRADQAIIRGGFKVHPDDVRATLEKHPAVRGAAVVKQDDERLGAVPVAVVELRADEDPVTADELLAWAGTVLARYELPTEIRVLDALPRTDSHKVDLAAVTALFEVADVAGPAPAPGA